MTVHATLDSRNGRRYCYYRCPKRGRHGVHKVCINGKHHRAAEAEAAVWDLISSLLKDPEHVRAVLEEMIEQERQPALCREGSHDRRGARGGAGGA
jgi:Recombinase zinc beta ribbon domain